MVHYFKVKGLTYWQSIAHLNSLKSDNSFCMTSDNNDEKIQVIFLGYGAI